MIDEIEGIEEIEKIEEIDEIEKIEERGSLRMFFPYYC